MNTPPSVDPDVAPLESDPSWALFDENSIRFASEPFLQQMDTQGPMQNAQNSVDPSQPGQSTHEIQDLQAFGNQETWDGYENPPDAWPSNLMRFFGNAEFPPAG